MTGPARGLLDTSVFIASESGRALDHAALPAEAALSVITFAELHAGVLAASDTDVRARRMATLDSIGDIELLGIDERVALAWARLRTHLVALDRRINVNDLWIAATALAHGLAVITQDADFDPVAGIGGLRVTRV